MRPLILITNDDGYQSKGIKTIAEIACRFGDVVVAPDGPRSAQSSALTIEVPISSRKVEERDGFTMYTTTGTPADCVKLAVSQLLPRKPDLLVSGINHGSNASINVIYSGTIGAAIEGSLHDIPSVGFSLCDHNPDADFSHCAPYFEQIIERTLREGLPAGVTLNVNAPKGEVCGVRVCRQARGRWDGDFTQTPAPRLYDYYWLTGHFSFDDEDKSGDQAALNEGYISLVPLQVDMTAYEAIQFCKRYEA